MNYEGDAALIIDAPGKCGEAGMTYLPALNRYVLVTWYCPICARQVRDGTSKSEGVEIASRSRSSKVSSRRLGGMG